MRRGSPHRSSRVCFRRLCGNWRHEAESSFCSLWATDPSAHGLRNISAGGTQARSRCWERWTEYLCRGHPSSVKMLGALDLDEMRLVMSASDLLLLPSREEGIALVLFEAMSMGAVPVATDVGGQRELVTPDCGVLLPFNERLADATAEALDALLTDEPLRRRLAGAGRKRVEEQFRLDQTGTQLDAIFRGVMRQRGAPLKARATPVDIGEIAGELAELQADSLAPDAWDQQGREGRWLPMLASRFADLLRRSPLRLWFRRFEIRYGTRMGRWITRRD